MQLTETTRWIDVINFIEEQEGWVYDEPTTSFSVATATHSLDSPDSFGRATSGQRVPTVVRPTVRLSFKFRRLEAGASQADVNAGATLDEFHMSMPEGVQTAWNSSTDRSYFEGVTAPSSGQSQPVVVNTNLKTVSSGIILNCITARLPGGSFRVDGSLEISAFTGTNLDKSVLSFPLNIDGPRGQWVRTVSFLAGDIAGDLPFKNWHGTLNATGEVLELLIRVD